MRASHLLEICKFMFTNMNIVNMQKCFQNSHNLLSNNVQPYLIILIISVLIRNIRTSCTKHPLILYSITEIYFQNWFEIKGLKSWHNVILPEAARNSSSLKETLFLRTGLTRLEWWGEERRRQDCLRWRGPQEREGELGLG